MTNLVSNVVGRIRIRVGLLRTHYIGLWPIISCGRIDHVWVVVPCLQWKLYGTTLFVVMVTLVG